MFYDVLINPLRLVFLHLCSYVLFMTLLLLIGFMNFLFMFANFRIYFLKTSSKMREKKSHCWNNFKIQSKNSTLPLKPHPNIHIQPHPNIHIQPHPNIHIHYLSNPTLTYIYNSTLTYIYITSQIPPSHTYTIPP